MVLADGYQFGPDNILDHVSVHEKGRAYPRKHEVHDRMQWLAHAPYTLYHFRCFPQGYRKTARVGTKHAKP